jgi:EcsC protein family
VSEHPDIEEGASLPVRKLLQWLGWLYEGAINGLPGVDGVEDLAQSYSDRGVSSDDDIDHLINWQVAKAGAAGFVTGVGGMLTLPVAIPANLAGVLYIQIRMIGAVAHLRGYDVRSDQVRTLVVACLAGSAALDILKGVGINIGTRMTRQMVLRISGEVLKRVNQAVGFRLVTKTGSKGAVNLLKGVPFVGGVVGGTFDAAATKVIGRTAKQVFAPLGQF